MSSNHNRSHSHSTTGREKTLLIAVILTFSFMVVEFIAGWWAGSLALMADAVHMLTDAGALGLALFAIRWSTRHADDHRTFGYGRLQVLAAFVNGLLVLGLAGSISYHAVTRFWHPRDVQEGLMLWVAVIGLVINMVIFAVLHFGDKKSVNIRAAMLHVMGDMLSSAAVIIAALIIGATGFNLADPIATFIVAALIARSAKNIIAETIHILLEGRPKGLDLPSIGAALKLAAPEVKDVHSLHAWSLSGEDLLMSLHVTLGEQGTRTDDAILHDLKHILHDKFGVAHSTIQLERTACADAPHHH